MLSNVLDRTYWGEPLPLSVEVESYRRTKAHNIIFSGGQRSEWDNPTDLSFKMVSYVVNHDQGFTNTVLMRDDSTVTFGELAFIAARYPKLYMGTSPNFFVGGMETHILVQLQSFCTNEESLAWVLIARASENRILEHGDFLKTVLGFTSRNIDFDTAAPFFNLGIYDAAVISDAIASDIDPRLLV